MTPLFTRPVVSFDLETTGTDIVKDRIVELGAVKVYDFGKHTQYVEKYSYLINPERPIPNSDIHGITDEMVKDQPTFKKRAFQFLEIFKGCDIMGFNIKRFDLALLAQEFSRCGIAFDITGSHVVDVFHLYKTLHPQTLSAAYQTYVGSEIDSAHRAVNDSEATMKVFQMMLFKDVIPDTLPELLQFQNQGQHDAMVDFAGKFIRQANGVVVFNFGKHKGAPAINEPGFLQWMIDKDFTEDTKQWCRNLLKSPVVSYNLFEQNNLFS